MRSLLSIDAETKQAMFKRIEGTWLEARTVPLFLENIQYHHARNVDSICTSYHPTQQHLNSTKHHPGYHAPACDVQLLSYLDFQKFAVAVNTFFDETHLCMRERFSETVTDNFCVIIHDEHCQIG